MTPTPPRLPTSAGTISIPPPALSQQQQQPDTPLQAELKAISYTLLELSICAADVNAPLPEDGPHGRVALKVSEVISRLRALDELKDSLQSKIPLAVLQHIDANKNPHLLTKERIERAAAENQFATGRLNAISSYRDLLGRALEENFPELGPHISK